jgi:hypothetical protein
MYPLIKCQAGGNDSPRVTATCVRAPAGHQFCLSVTSMMSWASALRRRRSRHSSPSVRLAVPTSLHFPSAIPCLFLYPLCQIRRCRIHGRMSSMCRSGLALVRPEGRLSVSRSGNAALRPSALRRLVNKPASTTRALPTVCAVSCPQFLLPGGVASRSGPAPRPWFAEPTPATHHTPAVSCEASASDSAASSGLPSAAKTAYLGSLFVLW